MHKDNESIACTPVKLAELTDAFGWVSGSVPFENAAYINRQSGQIHWTSSTNDLEEELPEDIEDGTLYLAVPHKSEFDLGRRLALQFAAEHLPASYEVVDDYFRRKGAYAQFKRLLERTGRLDAWHQYEAAATEQALREWAEEHGFHVNP